MKHQRSDSLYIYSFNHFHLYHAPLESHVLGYVYLEPKRHLEYWQDFWQEELTELSSIIPTMENFMRKYVEAERMYVVTISEAVRHLHLHLIPRSVNCNVRGIELIQQATQQMVKTEERITTEKINQLVHDLRAFLYANC
jgi:diadenosine tetraphosphate (Ap4A) HIT family hydrolase